MSTKTILACVAVSIAIGAAFRFLGGPPPALAVAPDVATLVAKLERRIARLEESMALAVEAHAEPAVVTRFADERGIEFDDAWNAYFDSIVSRIDALEAKLDGEEEEWRAGLESSWLASAANARRELWGQSALMPTPQPATSVATHLFGDRRSMLLTAGRIELATLAAWASAARDARVLGRFTNVDVGSGSSGIALGTLGDADASPQDSQEQAQPPDEP